MDRKFNFLFFMRPSGSYISDDGWEKRTDKFISSWEVACDVLKTTSYSYDGLEFHLYADWSPVVKSQRHYKKTMAIVAHHASNKEYEKLLGSGDPFQRKSTEIQIEVSILNSERHDDRKCREYATRVVESYLYDAFTILGIAAPGSCNFYKAKLRLVEPVATYVESDTEFDLSDFRFDLWDLDSDGRGFADAKMLDVKKVAKWFFSHRNGLSQFPESAIQKSLFSVWTLAKQELPENDVIWIFYALETLYSTEPGKNRSALISRISTFLELDRSQVSSLKKKLTSLYNVRSSIAHGGLKIRHPMVASIFDARTDENYDNLALKAQFGFTLFASSLQRVAERQLQSIKFLEEVQIEEMPIEF